MDADGLPNLKKYFSREKFKKITEDKRNILIVIILVLATGLFFSVLFERIAQAKERVVFNVEDVCELDPMHKIAKEADPAGKAWREYCEKKKEGENKGESQENVFQKEQEEYLQMVRGYPLEEMIPFISKKERRVAAFLIGIAKKESDWGRHSPQKNGHTCYNYWGYKGGYNPTSSGYSCFDSPEQAILEVGGRIEKLLSQKVDTPERMVVWKCGSSCAGHNPGSVKKWISDVRLYYNKIIS